MEQIETGAQAQRPAAPMPGDYGAAVDIGTTTVVLYAYDLTTGELLHTESLLNSQIARGADVISRILHTIQDPDGLEELNGLIRECINKLLAAVERRVPGFSRDLWHMVLCGNSTMQHLFLSLFPMPLPSSVPVRLLQVLLLPSLFPHHNLPLLRVFLCLLP